MRVLFVNCSRHPSGADVSMATMIQHLPDSVESQVLTHWRMRLGGLLELPADRLYRDYAMPYVLTTRAAGRYTWLQFAAHLAKFPTPLWTLARLRRRQAFDLVHVNDTPGIAYALAASLLGLPAVLHVRAQVDLGRRGAELLDVLASRERTAFVAIDDEVAHTLSQRCQAKTRVVHNPVHFPRAPTERDRARKRAAWNVPLDCTLVGQVANLYAYKGVWQVLELAEVLCRERQDLHFVLVGMDPPGGEGAALRHAAHQRGLADRFHLVGYEPDQVAVYAALDVALCLFGEGLGGIGRTAFEAAALGKPVVATLPGAARSTTFPHEQAGLVFEPAERGPLTAALRALVTSKAAREALGQRAQDWIGTRHAPERVAAAHAALYRELTTR
ncbi:MAG: glycosyltransferase family 4 protein [Myxococcales bacterium]|nr:glycosyltransferase family 4 protein [Myxococcales bacterium]MDD9969873.1 glycosyltransferase family 4 protein [Myxococcales bacterium]